MALSCSQAKIWVKSNYERNEDGVVAKSVMYKHYEDVCRAEERNVMETSIFGRVVKSVFPDVTIRRLGGRDNLKYYYCGIQAKETSPYAIDNTTTTRPKRRLRKRELVTEKVEVHSCLRWLHANYVASPESSVVKTDVYHRYISFCKVWASEPLSIQYFGMVITHAFPSVTKRKLGPRSNQQKFYFGIIERMSPMSLNVIPEMSVSVPDNIPPHNPSYRESVEDYEEDDLDDFSCRSPESDMSDIGYNMNSHTHFHNAIYDVAEQLHSSPASAGDVRSFHLPPQYFKDECEEEPVDYSLSSLRLKDEPIDDDEIEIKVDPTDIHAGNDDAAAAVYNNTLEPRSHSNSDNGGGGFPGSAGSSPTPTETSSYSRKIYKPRFHYNEESDWNVKSIDAKREDKVSSIPDLVNSEPENLLKNWIFYNFHVAKGLHVDRTQIYEVYETYCATLNVSALPMVLFDETVLKTLPGVVTMIHSSGKTFYAGMNVRETSHVFSRLGECLKADSKADDDVCVTPSAMELSASSEDLETSQTSSPLSQEEDEELPELLDIRFNSLEDDANGNSPSPGVVYDGKYYLRKWLTDNFYYLPESCILKADAYKYYEIFIRNMSQSPFEMNVFGKIVRQVFPEVSIRRLGGRARPQYHYCGIGVKETSPLHQYMSGKDPAQRSRKKEIVTDNRSAEIVIDFLRRNFEVGKHKFIMKSDVFDHYCKFCESLKENPVTLNYFGKLVKHCFPAIEVKKFGGRNEPLWYYFGLAAKFPFPVKSSKTPNQLKYGQPPLPLKDYGAFPSDVDHSVVGLPPTNRGSPFYGMEGNGNMVRHSTSPIPINLHRQHVPPLGYFSSTSPSSFQHHHSSLQALLRASSFEDHSHGSPADRSAFFRESYTPHSPAEFFYSRSPLENYPAKNQNFPMSSIDSCFNREYPQTHCRGGIPAITPAGQVVPSQTPPNAMMHHNHLLEENTVTRQIHAAKAKRPLTIQEEFGTFNEMAME